MSLTVVMQNQRKLRSNQTKEKIVISPHPSLTTKQVSLQLVNHFWVMGDILSV